MLHSLLSLQPHTGGYAFGFYGEQTLLGAHAFLGIAVQVSIDLLVMNSKGAIRHAIEGILDKAEMSGVRA